MSSENNSISNKDIENDKVNAIFSQTNSESTESQDSNKEDNNIFVN